ncbi:hypothetical protein BHE74_00049869, partial [Ensete ventricosum]
MPMEEKLIRKRKTVRRQTRKRRSSQRADVARELALAVDRPFDGDAVPRRKRECSGRRREIEKQQDELKGYCTCDLKATELGTEREPQCAHGFGCNPHLVHVSWFLSQIFTRCQGDRCVVNRGEGLTTVDFSGGDAATAGAIGRSEG